MMFIFSCFFESDLFFDCENKDCRANKRYMIFILLSLYFFIFIDVTEIEKLLSYLIL